MTRPRSLFSALLLVTLGAPVLAGGPADPLLKLVPADAGLTITVEDLNGHTRALIGSTLLDAIRKLPVFQSWKESNDVRGVREALGRIEDMLGSDLKSVREKLLGEAVVLTLRLPAGEPPDSARGLLLTKVADRPLLERLLTLLNTVQAGEGLKKISERRHGDVVYRAREFGRKDRPDEFYAVLEGGVFAWSNSEELVRGVIDRARALGGSSNLADAPGFRAVREKLPNRPLLSLYLEPRFAERLVTAVPQPADPREQQLYTVTGRYLAAVDYFGASLEWRDGPVLQTHEVIDPARLPTLLKNWASRKATPDPRLGRVPASTLIFASANVDLWSVVQLFQALTPENDRDRLDNLLVAVQGFMLGLNLRDQVSPRIGPAMSLHAERPETGRVPVVISSQLYTGPDSMNVAAAIDNGLRTFLALSTLDESRKGPVPRIEARTVGETVITSLGPKASFAYAVQGGRLVMGNSVDAVVRHLSAQEDPHANARFQQVKAKVAPGDGAFVCVDLLALYEFADGRRPALTKRFAARQHREPDDVARDLDHALSLISLFDVAYFTQAVDPALTSVHRTLGFVARDRFVTIRP